jgi:hypothetical protein
MQKQKKKTKRGTNPETLRQVEMMAWGVAKGLATCHAAAAAGFKIKNHYFYERAKELEFTTRVDELKAVIRWTEDHPGLMVAELMRCAGGAASLKSASAYDAAHKLIATAARLRHVQPPPPPLEPPPPILPRDEWMALYGAKD